MNVRVITVCDYVYAAPPSCLSEHPDLGFKQKALMVCVTALNSTHRPVADAAMRLISAMLAEKHESWSTGRLYFDMASSMSGKKRGRKISFKRCEASDEKNESDGE